jgi:uncharacterized protein YjiK
MKHFLHIVIIIFSIACNRKNEARQPSEHVSAKDSAVYKFDQPDKVFEMPRELKEISGIDKIDDTHFACIEDEHGILYIYDLKNQSITKKMKFSNRGDFEDVALSGDTAYALRSDGTIFRIDNYNATFVTSVINTSLKSRANTEGVCLDKVNHRLLIACKGESATKEILKHDKVVYGYDLATSKFDDKPVLVINQKEIEAKLNVRVDFAPSAIAVHPSTGDIYIIGTVGKLLLVFSSTGELKNIERLEGKYFIQPEGICITANGNIYISNEGRIGKGNILLFKPRSTF